jgi:hypothetical protein
MHYLYTDSQYITYIEYGLRVRPSTLSVIVCRLSRQCGILNILQPYRPPRPVTGIALLFLLYTVCNGYGPRAPSVMDMASEFRPRAQFVLDMASRVSSQSSICIGYGLKIFVPELRL